jgi:isopenicillin N synthase-like dioxygenase
MGRLPVIDISALRDRTAGRRAVANEIGRACREDGFFYVVGHGVDEELQRRLEAGSRAFFDQDLEAKLEIRMSRGGRAWRGYFPLGDELTSGRPDLKEGVYFGAELPADHPKVRAGTPLHGPNLFPTRPAELRDTVLAYLAAMTTLGHVLMAGIALSLELDESYFAERYTADPLILFRIFNYPRTSAPAGGWGVGEHTDYGLLTMLKQDGLSYPPTIPHNYKGGLQVKSRSGWIDAPPVPGSFVCNIGDMLDRLTGGRYRSTPHRVLPSVARDRLSWPFFFDPGFDADVTPVGRGELADDRDQRWDKESVHEFRGSYGDYLLAKIGKVFPELGRDVLG